MTAFHRIASICVIALTLGGCAHNLKENPDPYESFNRKVYAFNDGLYTYVGKPIHTVYKTIVPNKTRTGIRNFFQNIDNIPAIANDALQLKPNLFWHHTARFILNSTLGIFGLFDIASKAGFEPIEQNFGLTLAAWGYEDSAYLVLPFFGPSTIRDGIGRIPDMYTKPTAYIEPERDRYILLGIDGVQTISHYLPRFENLKDTSLDPYIGLRNIYLQNREHLIENIHYDGKIPPRAEPAVDDLLDEWGDVDWDEV